MVVRWVGLDSVTSKLKREEDQVPIAESIAAKLGASVATFLIKRWTSKYDLNLRDDPTLNNLLVGRFPKLLERRRVKRQFDQMVDTMTINLEPHANSKDFAVDVDEREKAVQLVCDTFDEAGLSASSVISVDLDAFKLEREIRSHVDPRKFDRLSIRARDLVDRLIRESANYIVDLLLTLPHFEAIAARELLARETALAELVNKVLQEIPKISTYGDSDQNFSNQYRRQLARKLDWLELFGIKLNEVHRRYALSVAYIQLTAAAHESDSGPSGARLIYNPYLTVTEAIARNNRVFIRGDAGSGKTTLLRWLAVQAAKEQFQPPLDHLNGVIPFYVPLRRYVRESMPTPAQFIQSVAANAADAMPFGWVNRQLKVRALLLVDGVDELPDESRSDVKDWLRDLCEEFPRTIVVVTSRPGATPAAWLSLQEYAVFVLQPMDASNLRAFVQHWHEAVALGMTDTEELESIRQLSLNLQAKVGNRQLRNLATNPLMCAMICALHRERSRYLPEDRMELYKIALEMLLERRDIERAVPMTSLSLRKKLLILQDLAWWFVLRGQSSAQVERVVSRLDAKLDSITTADGSNGGRIYKELLVRSGIIHEPQEGQVSFIHKTFQEYLAARAAIDEDLVETLVGNAHLEQWREVVILAAGHSSLRQRESLLNGIVDRGLAERSNSSRLYLLAVASLETSPELSRETRLRITSCVSELVPPRSLEAARALAGAGEDAVPYLGGHNEQNSEVVAACVHALRLIGGRDAMAVIASYGQDRRPHVVRELIDAWPAFHTDEYAKAVLADSRLLEGVLPINDPNVLPATQHLKHLKSINVTLLAGSVQTLPPLAQYKKIINIEFRFCEWLQDLLSLTGLESLRLLSVIGCPITDLAGIGAAPSLSILRAQKCLGLRNLESIESLGKLKVLDFLGSEAIQDLKHLQGLGELVELRLAGTGITSLTAIEGLPNLETLNVEGSNLLTFNSIPSFKRLRRLIAKRVPAKNFAKFAECRNLSRLEVSEGGEGSTNFISSEAALEVLVVQAFSHLANINSLEGYGDLEQLSLAHCASLRDISVLTELRKLRILDLAGCRLVRDLSPLATMPALEMVTIAGVSPQAYLPPLKRPKVVVVTDKQRDLAKLENEGNQPVIVRSDDWRLLSQYYYSKINPFRMESISGDWQSVSSGALFEDDA